MRKVILPVKAHRLVHRDFGAQDHVLDKGYNVSRLSEAGILDLTEECITSMPEISDSKAHEDWVAAFWKANLSITPGKFSHLPLVPTSRPLHFISLKKVDDPSAVVADEDMISRIGLQCIAGP